MSRNDMFTFRVGPQERRVLAALAQSMERSQADVIRVLLRKASRDLRPEHVRAEAQSFPMRQSPEREQQVMAATLDCREDTRDG